MQSKPNVVVQSSRLIFSLNESRKKAIAVDTKGGFFSESAMKFFQISKSHKEIFQKAILSLKSNFPPITVKCYWREI